MNLQKLRTFSTEDDRSDSEYQQHNSYTNGYIPFSDFITEKVSEDVTAAIVSDATYRVKELIQNCWWWISQKNSSCLTTEDVNQVLHRMNYPTTLGENRQDVPTFWNIGGVLVEDDPEIDLCSTVLNDVENFPLTGGLYVKNELIMGKGEDGNVSQLPDTLVRCYESMRAILCGCNEQHFRALAVSLRSNSLLGPILPYVVDDIAEQIKLASGNEIKLYCLFDVVNALVSNEFVDLSKSVSINKLMASLLSVAFSHNSGQNEDLRRKSADMLGRSMLRWPNILLVREVLHKLNKCLQDSLLPLQVQRGALHILATMGNASLALVLWPLLLNRPTYGHFLEAIRSKPELAADYAAIQDTLLVCSLALQETKVGLDIPIKNVASVTAAGCPDAIHRLFTDLMGEDVMCCRWPVPPPPPTNTVVKRRFLPSVSIASSSLPAQPKRQPQKSRAPSWQKQNRHGAAVFTSFNVLRLKEARRRKLEGPMFQGHTRFQRLCSVHLRHGKQQRTVKMQLAVNLRNVF